MEILFILAIIFIGGPFLAVMIFTLFFIRTQELDRPPTKDEWKAGKRTKNY